MKQSFRYLGCVTVLLVFAQPLLAAEPPITAVVFTPGGELVVACSQSGVHIYDWPALKKQKTISAKSANLHAVAFSPDSKRLAVGGGVPAEEGIIELFQWPEAKSIATLGDHSDCVRSLRWVNDSTIVSASIDRDLKLWNINDPQKPTATLRGHSREVSAICLVENGDAIISTGGDQSVRVWNRKSQQLTRSLNQHTKPVNALAVRPAAGGLPMVASAASDRTVRFWQPTIGRMVRYIRLESEPLAIEWLNESFIAAACIDGNVRIVNADEVQVAQTTRAINGWAYCLAVHPKDGALLVGGAGGKLVRIEVDAK